MASRPLDDLSERLRLHCFNHGKHVRQRNVALNVMGSREDVATIGTPLEQSSNLRPDLLGRPEWQRPLRRQAAVKAQPPMIRKQQTINVHHLGLERVVAAHSGVDQVFEELIHIAIRVDHDVLARFSDDAVHPPEVRKDHLAPEGPSHLETALLPPVVSEVHGIDVVPEGFVDLGDVVVGDGSKQLMDKSGMIVKVQHEVLHAAKSPASLIKGEANLEDTEAIRKLINSCRDLGEEARVQGIREPIPGHVRVRKNAALDDANVLVDAAIPHDSEYVLHAIVTEIVKEADVTSQLEEMVLYSGLDGVRSVMQSQSLAGFLGEPNCCLLYTS